MESDPLPVTSLDVVAATLRARLETSNLAREETLRSCRETIQYASRTIRAVHRGEMEAARALAAEANARVTLVRERLAGHPEIYWAGYVHDAQKEYVEAEAMLAIVGEVPIPNADALGVEPAAYLNGIAEAASESRRYVLDRLRLGDMERANSVLRIMDDIYYELITFDFPDAITGGLRRTTDSLRAVLERTRGDLTLTMAQHRLENALVRGSSAGPDAE